MALLEKVALDYLLALHDRRQGRQGAGADPRDRLRQAAQGREEARGAGRGGARRGATAAGGARRGARRRRGGGAGGRRRARGPEPRGRPRPADGAGRAGRPAPSSPATRSAATRTSTAVYARLRRAREPADAPRPARRHGGVPRLLRDEVPPQQASSPTRPRSSSPAACSTTSPSTTRSRSPSSKAEGAYLWDVDGNRYIDFLQAGGPTVLGSNYAPVREKVVEVVQRVRARSPGCSTSTSSSWRELVNRLHAGRRDVPHARLRHRGRDGRHPRGARLHRQEVGHQGRRRLPRLERPDGLRPARARHLALRGQGHPARRHARARGRSSPTTSSALRRKLMREPAAGRHGGGHRRAARARERHAAGAVRLQRRACASCATSSARC